MNGLECAFGSAAIKNGGWGETGEGGSLEVAFEGKIWVTRGGGVERYAWQSGGQGDENVGVEALGSAYSHRLSGAVP